MELATSQPRRRRSRGRPLAAIVAAISFASASSAGLDEILERIRSAGPDLEQATRIESLEVELGGAELRIEQGWLVPVTPVNDTITQLVFVGDARFRQEAHDSVEASQLERFTGSDELDVAVDAAVLVIADDELPRSLLDRGSPGELGPDEVERVRSLFADWRAGVEYRGLGIEVQLLKDALGDAFAQDFLAVWCRSRSLGTFSYLYRPEQIEQISTVRFARDPDAPPVETPKRRKGKRRRREIPHDLPPGDWDVWLSTTDRGSDGLASPGGQGFEPEHYGLTVRLEGEPLELAGTAEIDVVSIAGGRRTLELSLSPDLEIKAIRDGEEHRLAWHRADETVVVELAQEIPANGRFRLAVEYGGAALHAHENEPGILTLKDTVGWYPHVGTADRATYRAEFRWAGDYELLAGGERVEKTEEEGAFREIRAVDVPVSFYSFEIGSFSIKERQAGHVRIRAGFALCPHFPDPNTPNEIMETLVESLELYETLFGPYPLDELTVATSHRNFSQGSLSFVTLALGILATHGIDLLPTEHRETRIETVAHEVAHQWWGNKVGWVSYRDQWLSEALAEYSAKLFTYYHLGRDLSYRTRFNERLRDSLAETNAGGRSLESLGPVVLGRRLESSLGGGAYRVVVYDKGYLVFSSIAQFIGEVRFLKMLGTLADRVAFRDISTETFLKAMERMSGQDLAAFARRFVYGTGIPTLFYRYQIEGDADTGWTVKGSAHQMLVEQVGTRIVRGEGGGWDAVKLYRDELDPENSIVPSVYGVRIEVGERVEPEFGALVLNGRTPVFEIQHDRPLLSFSLDPGGRAAAVCIDETVAPKGAIRQHARALAHLRRWDEARELFENALAAEFLGGHAAELDFDRGDIERNARIQDRGIHLDMAEMWLDAGRIDAAGSALAAADEIDPPREDAIDWRRTTLEARLALRREEYKRAHSAFKRHIRLEFKRITGRSAVQPLPWKDIGEVGEWDGQAYALFAIAAHHAGYEQDCRGAIRQAYLHGTRVTKLQALH